MSAKGAVHDKMLCPECRRAVAYSDDAAGDRWLRSPGPKSARCPGSRRIGKVSTYYQFWIDKGLIEPRKARL
jgi:hypothetical protein